MEVFPYVLGVFFHLFLLFRTLKFLLVHYLQVFKDPGLHQKSVRGTPRNGSSSSKNHILYTRSGGHPALVKVLAEMYTPLFDLGRPINPMTEVTVSVGASEGLFATMQAFLNEGDEVILLEPAFDIYAAQVQMAGGKSVYVPLRPSDEAKGTWKLDLEELESAITPQTKILLLNTPHNPTGKVFNRKELEGIAEVVKRYPNMLVLTDEVYENILYGDHKHERFASLPDMWERTLTISSAGKTFSLTGWKVGWLVGHERLIQAVMETNQWIQFSVPTTNQQAVAYILQDAQKPFEGFESFYAYLRAEYNRKKERLCEALCEAGIEPMEPEGGIFVMGDTSKIQFPKKYLEQPTDACPDMTRDWAFCRWLTIEKGVAAIPPSAFYCSEHRSLAGNYARFAICKMDETIEESYKRLQSVGTDLS